MNAAKLNPASNSSLTRLVSPEGEAKLQAALKKAQEELSTATVELSAQKRLMLVSFFSQAAYAQAEVKLHKLEQRVDALTTKVKEIQHTMLVA